MEIAQAAQKAHEILYRSTEIMPEELVAAGIRAMGWKPYTMLSKAGTNEMVTPFARYVSPAEMGLWGLGRGFRNYINK